MRRLFYVVTKLALFAALLTGCSVAYQPSNGVKEGYQDFMLPSGCIVLTYVGNGRATASALQEVWQRRATEWCPTGFDIVSMNRDIRHGSMVSPVGGGDARLGTQTPVLSGVFKCMGGIEHISGSVQASEQDRKFIQLAADIWSNNPSCG
ncbi:hypothetical protein [Shewanella woodyi]|nr:hypothetical protein [Shewanella woodyi]